MKCRICGNDEANQAYDVREMMFGSREVFGYFQCAQCQCLQIAEIPPDMSPYYPDDYYSYDRPDTRKRGWKRLIHRARFNHALRTSSRGAGFSSRFPSSSLRFLDGLAVTRNTSMLDVGCGAGALLHGLHELGMKNLLGIDPYNTRDIDYGNGLQIQRKSIDEVSGRWDIVMFHHSFEHMPDPLGTLRRAAGLLSARGHCVIRVPLASSHAWEHYGVDWVQLDAPRHFFLHSERSLRVLAGQAGLTLRRVIYDSTGFQLWGSELYARDIPLCDARSHTRSPAASRFSKADLTAFNKRARQLNATGRGDQAIFYFGKT